MIRRALPMAALAIWSCGLAAGAESAPAAAEGADAGPQVVSAVLNLGGKDYTAEVTLHGGASADLRLLRADGASMADESWVLAELGGPACREAGLRFDAGLPPLLAADGSWLVARGCK